MANGVTLVVGILIFSCVSYAKKDTVPFFMWSDNGIKHSDAISSEAVNLKHFSESYLDALLKPKQNIVAFIQDYLSLDDITKYADVYNMEADGATFHNLKAMVEEKDGLQLPAVTDMSDILNKLKNKFSGAIHELKEPYNIKDLALNGGNHLIIAKLSSRRDSDAAFAADLKKNDEIMKKVVNEVKAMNLPITAFYTGNKPSQQWNAINKGRHLLEVDADPKKSNHTFFNLTSPGDGERLYFYTTNVTVKLVEFNKDKKFQSMYVFVYPELKDNGFDKDSKISNDSAFLSWSYGAVEATGGSKGKMESLKLRMQFESGSGIWAGMWRMSNFSSVFKFSADKIKLDKEADFRGDDLYAPNTFSYHCTEFQYATNGMDGSDPDKVYKLYVQLSDFQTQLMGGEEFTFGRPNDCTGFFTIPILTGIFAGLLLVMILFFGVSMIASISTMDRFDDPKGQGIVVNASD